MRDRAPKIDDVFVERISALLREPVRLGDEFETKLVPLILVDRPVERRPISPLVIARPLGIWWWKGLARLRISSVAGLMIILSAVGIGALIGIRAQERALPASVFSEVAYDTVNVVRFVYTGDAKSVSLVGDFNGWAADATPMARVDAKNTWSASVPLAVGRHDYAFIVDGTRWVVDPLAPVSSDHPDAQSSVVTVEAAKDKSLSTTAGLSAKAERPAVSREIKRALARRRGGD